MDFIVNMFDNMPVNVVVVFFIFTLCTVDAPVTINRGDNHTRTHYKGDMTWPLDCVSLPPDEAVMSCRWWTWSVCLPMSNSNSIHGLLVVDTGQRSPPLLNENEREESTEPKPCGQSIPPRVGDTGPLSPCDAHGCGSDVSVVHVSSSPGRDMVQCHAEVISLLKELLDGQKTGVTPAGGPSACVTRCTPLLSGLQCSRPSFPCTTLTTYCRSLKTHMSTVTESILQQWYHFSPMNIDVFLHVHFTSVLHSHCANVPGSAEWQPDALTPSQDAPRGKSTSNSTSHLTKQRHQETLDRPNGKSFINQPFWSKIFTFNQNHKRRDDINSRVDSLLVKLLYPLVIIMTIIYRYLPLIRKEEKGKNDNIIYFRLLTHSFFLKWQWTRPKNVSTAETIKNLKGITLKEAEHPSVATRTDKKTPQTNIFNEHILRPWLYKGRLGHIESSLGNEQAHTSKGFSHMPPTSHPRVHERYHVNPSIRFLPDATFNPALDLAHPGYRLATLSALPPTVPVSRVKLADAGFYFRGQGDEVTCYSCQQRHSGWSRDDNPMDVHRRLSPTCEHVLQADRERQASTPSAGPSSTPTAGPSSTPTAGLASIPTAGQASASASNGQESSSPAEDGEGPDPTPPPHPDPNPPPHRAAAPLETISSTDRSPLPAHSNVGSSLLHQGVPPVPTTAAGSVESRQNTTNGHALETEPPGGRQAEQRAIVSNSWRSSNTAATSASSDVQPLSRPAENTLSGSLGNAARGSEPRFLFPRAALDLGGAVYPMYQDMASRRRSFTTWDDSRAPPLDQVLLCGMFYAGEWWYLCAGMFYAGGCTCVTCSMQVSGHTCVTCSMQLSRGTCVQACSMWVGGTCVTCSMQVSGTCVTCSMRVGGTCVTCSMQVSGGTCVTCSMQLSRGTCVQACSMWVGGTCVTCSMQVSGTCVQACSVQASRGPFCRHDLCR